jgi:hypothetical protein
LCTQHYFSPCVRFLRPAACLLLVSLGLTVYYFHFLIAPVTAVSQFLLWRSDGKYPV